MRICIHHPERVVLAKGLCSSCYQKMKRNGVINPNIRRRAEDLDSVAYGDGLASGLAHAQKMYDAVIGLQGRMRWKKVIDSIRVEIAKTKAVTA